MGGVNRDVMEAIFVEFARLNLPLEQLPGLAVDAGAEDEWLAHLRALPVGATWLDVFPDLPPDWLDGGPEGPVLPTLTLEELAAFKAQGAQALGGAGVVYFRLAASYDESAVSGFFNALSAFLKAEGRTGGCWLMDSAAEGTPGGVHFELHDPPDLIGRVEAWLRTSPGVDAVYRVPRMRGWSFDEEELRRELTMRDHEQAT